jgi:hypothetical protein
MQPVLSTFLANGGGGGGLVSSKRFFSRILKMLISSCVAMHKRFNSFSKNEMTQVLSWICSTDTHYKTPLEIPKLKFYIGLELGGAE